MPLQELIPIFGGFLVGLALSRAGGGKRTAMALAVIAIGAAATFATGEFLVSPVFFVVDIGLAAISAAVTLVVLRQRRVAS